MRGRTLFVYSSLLLIFMAVVGMKLITIIQLSVHSSFQVWPSSTTPFPLFVISFTHTATAIEKFSHISTATILKHLYLRIRVVWHWKLSKIWLSYWSAEHIKRIYWERYKVWHQKLLLRSSGGGRRGGCAKRIQNEEVSQLVEELLAILNWLRSAHYHKKS